MASDTHVIGTRFGCFLVRSVRRMPPSARHQVQVLLTMRETPPRLAHGGPAEPRGVVEPPPPPVEASRSRNVEAGSPTNVEKNAPQTTQVTPSGAAAAQTTTPNVPTHQATSSSSAIVSSGGEHVKCSADHTVEGEIPMSQIKRPRGRPITRVLPMPGTAEYTEGCPGCRRFGYHHNVQCKRRTADRAAIASHEGGESKRRAADRAAGASHVGGAISIQTTSQAAGGAAISSRVGGFSNQIQVATQAGVQAKAEPTAVHVGAANQGELQQFK